MYCSLQLYIHQFSDLGDSVSSTAGIQQSQIVILASVWGISDKVYRMYTESVDTISRDGPDITYA